MEVRLSLPKSAAVWMYFPTQMMVRAAPSLALLTNAEFGDPLSFYRDHIKIGNFLTHTFRALRDAPERGLQEPRSESNIESRIVKWLIKMMERPTTSAPSSTGEP